ncbi:hypothetical protein [Afifella marina]|nr:hypothetical protein [Afifella marina]
MRFGEQLRKERHFVALNAPRSRHEREPIAAKVKFHGRSFMQHPIERQ